MNRIAIYPGSFDPLTIGHRDIILRASRLFDTVIVAVLHNVKKKGFLSVEERVMLIGKACGDIPNVRAESWDGMLADYVMKTGACAVIRGLRDAGDLAAEFPMAELNKRLCPALETVFLASAPEYTCISSSAVREIGGWGRDIAPFVPECIAEEIQSHFPSR